MARHVFISYSSEDHDAADIVCHALEARGIACWMAPRDILPGKLWAESILDALENASAMLLLFTASANLSVQIHREIDRAVHKGVPVIPLRLENVLPTRTMEYFISTTHWLDVHQPPLDQHMDRVAHAITALLAKPGAGTAGRAPRRRKTTKSTLPTDSASVAVTPRPLTPPAPPPAEPPPPSAAATVDAIPMSLGNYDLAGPLGTGRFGSMVYAGMHRLLGYPVAIRTFRAGPGDNRNAVRERFLREARALQVVHRNVIHVKDFGESGDVMYVVTDLLPGCSLGELVSSEGQLPFAKLVMFVQELTDATEAVHAHDGLISGLHPEIVRVVRGHGSERLAISSAGISTARDLLLVMNEATLRGQTTPSELCYVAPELLMGRTADRASDVFTIGALAYLMATGRPPFEGASLPELLGTMLGAPPPDVALARPDIRAAAAATIMRCIESDPRRRFGTAAEVARAWKAATSA
jgi:hypothetical protein